MAIDRLRSPYNNLLVVTGDVGPSAFASIQVGGVAPYTFIGDGTANTIVGVTYRVHRFDYNATSQSLTFSQAGNVDILVAAGGGCGGGSTSGPPGGAGGGGAGGLILMYSYGVTATTYNVTVGKGGYGTDDLGGFYYTNAVVNAQNSVFGALTAIRGGQGAPAYSSYSPQVGGSGGGAGQSAANSGSVTGASGTPGQGNAGGNLIGTPFYVPSYAAGGGGSYVEKGGNMTSNGAGKGGDGLLLRFDGTSRGYCAGGGGGAYSTWPAGAGGANGGGNGKTGGSGDNVAGAATSYGCGGGGGTASGPTTRGGAGYNGVVLVRYALG
jgi:hypothetical protein